MNQFLVILFTHLYLLMSMGASTHLHYCGQELASVSLILPYNSCACEEEQEADGCCKNEVKITQIKDTQQAVNYVLIAPAFLIKIFDSQLDILDSLRTFSQEKVRFVWEQPPPLNIALHVLFCVYRI